MEESKVKKIAIVAVLLLLLLAAVSTYAITQAPSHATYSIEADAEEGGSISPAGRIVLDEGGSQTFTAAADAGYAFAGFKVDDVSVPSASSVYTFEDVRSNHAITAKFVKLAQYTVTSSATEGGTIAPSGETVVAEGGSVKFTAVPSVGYVFAYYEVDGQRVQSSGPEYTLSNIHSDYAVAAVFVRSLQTFAIDASATEGGTIDPAGSIAVPAGGSQTFAATPDAGYAFVGFEVDGAMAAGTDAVYTFTGVSASHAIRAVFERAVVTEHTITATATEGGTITPAGSIAVPAGGSQTFAFAADAGHSLALVVVDGVAIEVAGDSYTFEAVDADHTISAVYSDGTTSYIRSISVIGYAIAIVGEPFDTSSIEVVAELSDGSTAVVTGWTIEPSAWDEVGKTEAVVDYKGVATTVTVSVVYRSYAIIATSTEGGSIVPGSTAVVEGGSQTFAAVPEPGYLFSHFVVDGEIVEGTDIYTFEDIRARHVIEAVFVPGAPALCGIEIVEMPAKTTYFEGDMFDREGMVVMGHYSDGTVSQVYRFSETPAVLKIVDTVVVISACGFTAEVPVTVVAVVAVSIEITKEPTTVGYFVGEDLDTEGMIVTATYNNGTKSPVTGYAVSPTHFDTPGKVTETVSYHGLTATFAVTVYDDTPTTVSIKSIDGEDIDKPLKEYKFEFPNMCPGDSHVVKLVIKNETARDLSALLFVSDVNGDVEKVSDDGAAEPSLYGWMKIQCTGMTEAISLGDAIENGLCHYDVSKNTEIEVTMTITFDPQAPNELQNKSISFVFGVGRYQPSTDGSIAV